MNMNATQKTDSLAILARAYKAAKTNFSFVSIAMLAECSGLELSTLHALLLELAAEGNAQLSVGDWSSASEFVRSGVLRVGGSNYLTASIL